MVAKCRCPPKRSRRLGHEVELVGSRAEYVPGADYWQHIWDLRIDGRPVQVARDLHMDAWSIREPSVVPGGPDTFFQYATRADLLHTRPYLRPHLIDPAH